MDWMVDPWRVFLFGALCMAGGAVMAWLMHDLVRYWWILWRRGESGYAVRRGDDIREMLRARR